MNKARKLAEILRVPEYRAALVRYLVPAAVEHETVLRAEEYKTVVDIGANSGQFTLVARRCCPLAKVIAFEPLPGASDRFRRIFKNDPYVSIHQIAVGETSRTGKMHLSAKDHSSSLLRISRLQTTVFPGTGPVGTQSVRVERLDAIVKAREIRSPALLKIDVQGYELMVLKGCKQLLSSFDCVYVECSFVEFYENQASAHDVVGFLIEQRLQLKGIFNLYSHNGVPVQGDFLFMRTGSLESESAKQNIESQC